MLINISFESLAVKNMCGRLRRKRYRQEARVYDTVFRIRLASFRLPVAFRFVLFRFVFTVCVCVCVCRLASVQIHQHRNESVKTQLKSNRAMCRVLKFADKMIVRVAQTSPPPVNRSNRPCLSVRAHRKGSPPGLSAGTLSVCLAARLRRLWRKGLRTGWGWGGGGSQARTDHVVDVDARRRRCQRETLRSSPRQLPGRLVRHDKFRW